MEVETRRLFFAMDLFAPWPQDLPHGRIIDENHRHVTLGFLGYVDFAKLKELLKDYPIPSFKVGFAGKFDQCLFLPKRHPHVVAWHLHLLERKEDLNNFQKKLSEWLKNKGFPADDKHDFNPHVTLARSPFPINEWKEAFRVLPFYLKDIQLYESLGHSKYHSLWHIPLLAPFDSIEHTADLAFIIRGETFNQLFWHAYVAIAFFFPEILNYEAHSSVKSIEEVIEKLNEVVFLADKDIGCPFKAVSFHTDLVKRETHMEWEMIVDV